MTALFFLTILLLFGVGLVFAQTDRQTVMAHWDKRRCDLSVLLASNLYKPANDPRSGSQFAKENLSFCVGKMVQQVLTVSINPYLYSFANQFQFLNIIQQVIVSVKGMIAQFFRSFSRIFDGFYRRFVAIGFNFRKTFVLFLTAMNRAFGIATGTLYAGFSMIRGIMNFYDAVIKIIMIVLIILAAVVILLFLAFAPVIPVILTTIAVLVAGGVATGGLKSTFCFHPKTQIRTMRGIVSMEDLKIDDILADGGKIEGILKVSGSGCDIYNLKGVRVSGDHLVYYESLEKWILVKDHPEAKKEIKQEPILICLNTSTREIPLSGMRFRDWEEIPTNRPDIQEDWNKLIATMLGASESTSADQYPLLNGAWFVETPEGKVALRYIDIGTKIRDENGKWTKVLGIYEGVEDIESGPNSFWHTDSIWWKEEGTWKQKQVQHESKTYKKQGYHLITDSGTFKIFSQDKEHIVRDFTEVGFMRIAETYEWMKQRL